MYSIKIVRDLRGRIEAPHHYMEGSVTGPWPADSASRRHGVYACGEHSTPCYIVTMPADLSQAERHEIMRNMCALADVGITCK